MKPTEVVWNFVIGRLRKTRLVITQRLDGPFGKHEIGGPGHYYIAAEDLKEEGWMHLIGSTEVAHSYSEALEVAKRKKKELRK